MNQFGIILKHIRNEEGVTQVQLAKYLNVTDRSIRDWENEKTEPNYDTLIKLANYFDVSVDYLIGRKEY